MTTTMDEPEWDEASRELVLALDSLDLCHVCGRPTKECQDPDRQFDWKVGAPVRCHATTALLQAQARVTEETNPQMEALMWPVALRQERESGG